ncbi:MAG TPA: SDR family NAD(P)-dependent oxidoreductase [Candidatus Cybelea sp.]|nr:SDR family NAD(P)-dependent oxidoreductase [Candidatus Cybelea sp.]
MSGASQLLSGRVALVTGAGRGIGKAIAEHLGQAGAKVVVADNGTSIAGDGADPLIAQEVAKSIGANAVAYTESIASPSTAAACVALARDAFGGIDIVVNNAAILRDAFIFKGNPEDWEAVIRNNLSAAWYVLAAATPIMREHGKSGRGGKTYTWGRIVNIVSTAGLYGNYGQAAYASAKAGLVGLTRVVALDMQRNNVTCNAVAPFAATRVTDSIKPANDAQASYKARAQKVQARHVANVVGWLVSDFGAGISGQIFGVRGREVFLFSQPRPIARRAGSGEWTAEALADAAKTEFAPHYLPLSTDLEAFDTEPLV